MGFNDAIHPESNHQRSINVAVTRAAAATRTDRACRVRNADSGRATRSARRLRYLRSSSASHLARQARAPDSAATRPGGGPVGNQAHGTRHGHRTWHTTRTTRVTNTPQHRVSGSHGLSSASHVTGHSVRVARRDQDTTHATIHAIEDDRWIADDR